ncbi:MAG: type II and III secretion system protein family protein [Rhizobiaceae bacterium]|nr:type II and III secretion system protein family protein [Rhizobiaceae bacterium]
MRGTLNIAKAAILMASTVAMLAATPVWQPSQALAASTRVTATTASQRIKLGLNKSIVIDLPSDAYDILVANPAVADAVTRTSRRIYLFGKAVGETNIFVFGANGEQIASLDLQIERDVAGLEAYIKKILPTSDVTVELLNDNVVLTGTVDTPLDAKRAAELAQIFVTGGEATTGQYSQTASAPTDGGGVSIDNPDSQRQVSKIVNLLQIIGEDQVMLKVTVAEVSRNVMKQLGVNLMVSNTNNDGISFGALTDNVFGLGKSLIGSGGSTLGLVKTGVTALDASLDAMEQAGVMKTLAEPTLTAVSGEQATFRVGGEFNIVTGFTQNRSQDNMDGDPTWEHERIEYGIGLEFKPVVLSAGRISLKVRTSVSEPTNEGSLATGGKTNIISLRKRLADTTVELPSGGTMMIAGLVRDDVRQVINGLPGASKIPVLGTMFRSRDFVRNETELVILITPYLTKPTARSEQALPTDNFNPASDLDGMFMGKVNRIYGTTKTAMPTGQYHGVVGYIYK